MTHLLAAVGSVACFVLVAVLAVLAARSGRRPAVWHCLWLDGKDPARRRVCSGARSVRGPVVYRHLDYSGRVVYVGQAVNFARRMYQEGKERMSAEFNLTIATACHRSKLDEVERSEIAAYRPHLNRTKGNR